MVPLQFNPIQVFNETQHKVDRVAKRYIEKSTADVHDRVPVDVTPDGNCLYHSICLLMDNSSVTPDELRGERISFFSPMLLNL